MPDLRYHREVSDPKRYASILHGAIRTAIHRGDRQLAGLLLQSYIDSTWSPGLTRSLCGCRV